MDCGVGAVKEFMRWHNIRGVFQELDFFFFWLRAALKDCPKGPPTTANRHQPAITKYQPPSTAANRQLLPTANRHEPWLNI